jgi:hypothetical protein
MKTLTRTSLGLAIVTALVAVGLFALASPAGAYAPLPPGPGAQLQPPCRIPTTLTGNPLGAFITPTYFERYQGDEAVASGWAIDPQAGSGPIDVRVDFVLYRRLPDGQIFADAPVPITRTANLSSSNTCLLGMGLGSQHGFRVSWAPWRGPGGTSIYFRESYFRVDACVTAINVGWGQDTTLGCQTVWNAWP